MSPATAINPAPLPRPSGFSYAISASGARTVHFAGHTAADAQGRIVGPGRLTAQFEQVLLNLQATSQAAELGLSQVVKLTLYVTDIQAYRAEVEQIGAIYRRFFGSHYPAMTLVQVQRLWDEEAMIEIDAVAVE